MEPRLSLVVPFLIVSAVGLTGCVATPEHCRGCLAALRDAGSPSVEVPLIDVAPGGRGGEAAATGGAPGSGGAASGGSTGTGGAGTGGAIGTGGAATGGMGTGGSSGSGGAATGGAATGGMGTGGAGTGGAGTGGAGGAAIDPDLVLWYKFDETAGTAIADSAMLGGTPRNGTLTSVGAGTFMFSTMHQVGTGSLDMTGSSATVGAYATTLPSPGLQMLTPGAVTISCWVRVKSNQMWQRVFDFGNTVTPPLTFVLLTTTQATTTPNSPKFSISTMGTAMEQAINMTTPAPLSLNVWHHLVVVLPAGATYTGTLYIDGAVAGTNPAMTLHPSGLGATANNYLGRSQFASDPYLNAQLDDFRIYRRALTAAEVTALYAVR